MTLIERLLQMKGDSQFLVLGNMAIEGGGRYRGFEYIVAFRPFGHRCGYVQIPKEFQIENSEYDHLDVHGDITFFSHIDGWFDGISDLSEYNKKIFWIGFDTAHAGDKIDLELSEKLWPTGHPMKGSEAFIMLGDEPRLYDFMEAQCKHLIDQLVDKKINNKML